MPTYTGELGSANCQLAGGFELAQVPAAVVTATPVAAGFPTLSALPPRRRDATEVALPPLLLLATVGRPTVVQAVDSPDDELILALFA